MDNVEQEHESVRVMPFTGELSEMRPVAEICSGKQTHLCVRGLEPSHMHAILRQPESAVVFWSLTNSEHELAVWGVDVMMHKPCHLRHLPLRTPRIAVWRVSLCFQRLRGE